MYQLERVDLSKVKPNKQPMKYPFPSMEVGHAFAVDIAERESARVAAHNWGRRNGAQFRVRKDDDGRTLVIRIA